MTSIESLLRAAVGGRDDWRLTIPTFRMPNLGLGLIGPLLILASTLVGWLVFAGAEGEEGDVGFGLWIGSTSIVLMAWAFVLSVRITILEPLFGGLDSAYRVHRWVGALAVGAMWLHTNQEPENELIAGASKDVADTAQDLAGTGQTILYVLVGLSIIRWVPYRWWRLTHKLLVVPFAMACWHFYTASKPYANGSPWGVYFGTIMVIGLVAWTWRVVVKDVIFRGKKYQVSAVTPSTTTLELELEPVARPMSYRTGQFAAIKIQARGLSEPHLFTIASSPHDDHLRFFIRDLGDWTEKVQTADLVGTTVFVEGPFGEFEPLAHREASVVWIAGGVGITPFLSAVDSLQGSGGETRPTLIYCIRDADSATAIHKLREAHDDGRIRLELFESSAGRRFTRETFAEVLGDQDLRYAHVAVCGPRGLVRAADSAARALGARDVETEDFDVRSGVGPDLSRQLADVFAGK